MRNFPRFADQLVVIAFVMMSLVLTGATAIIGA